MKNLATLFKKRYLAQAFSCEFCKISKDIFSYRTPRVAAPIEAHSKKNQFSGRKETEHWREMG